MPDYTIALYIFGIILFACGLGHALRLRARSIRMPRRNEDPEENRRNAEAFLAQLRTTLLVEPRLVLETYAEARVHAVNPHIGGVSTYRVSNINGMPFTECCQGVDVFVIIMRRGTASKDRIIGLLCPACGLYERFAFDVSDYDAEYLPHLVVYGGALKPRLASANQTGEYR